MTLVAARQPAAPTPAPQPRARDVAIDVPHPDVPAQPPTGEPPQSPAGDHRSVRVKFANWMESSFGAAYLPITMGVGGAAAGGAAFFALDRLTHIRPLAIGGGVVAVAAGALISGALIFSD